MDTNEKSKKVLQNILISRFIKKYVPSEEELEQHRVVYAAEMCIYPPYSKINNYEPYKLVSEAIYHTYRAEDVKGFFFSTRRERTAFIAEEKHKTTLSRYDSNWLQYISHVEIHASQEITKSFRLSEWQFNVIELSEGDKMIAIIIPDLVDNIEIIKKVMSLYGYFLSQQKDYPHASDFKVLYFMPKFQEYINEQLKGFEYLWHVSPEKYKNRILEQGLLAKSDNILYEYPDRIYLIPLFGGDDCEYKDYDDEVKKYLTKLVRYIRGEKKIENKWAFYRIHLNDIPNVKFSIDYTMDLFQDSLYTTDAIRPSAIEYVDSVDLSKIIVNNSEK